MSVITQAGNAPHNRPTSRSRPNCTHHRMDRLYGAGLLCDMCSYPSPLGWLYLCRQDKPEIGDYQTMKSLMQPQGHETSFGESLRQAGLSESVIRQAQQGVYTAAQLDILKTQKEHMRRTIEQSMPLTYEGGDGRASLDGPNTGFHPRKPCGFKVCHACRPFFIDRHWMSFDAVFENEVRPLDKYELCTLPIKDVMVMKTLGLRRPTLPHINTTGFSRANSQDRTPSSGMTSDAFTSDSESSCEDNHEDDSWSTSRGTPFVSAKEFVCDSPPVKEIVGVSPSPDTRRTIRIVPDANPPRRLRRISASVSDCSPARSNTTASSISLPATSNLSNTPASDYGDDSSHPIKALTDPGFCPTPGTPSLRSGMSMSRTSSASSLGFEVEVEGGVALTEEAVRTHTPDLLTKL